MRLMADLIQLSPHANMSVQEALEFSARNHEEYQDVLIVGFDQDGRLMMRSSHVSRELAVFLLLEAIDHARGK
jgi:hypothetical protein